MLQILLTDTGRAEPQLCCDSCRQPITNARLAAYLWLHPQEGQSIGDLFVAHKRECMRAIEARVPDGEWRWAEMAYLPLYLGNGMQIDWPEAIASAAQLAALG